MPSLVIDDLSAKTHDTLVEWAAENGRSLEAEVLAILDATVLERSGAGFAAAMQALGRRCNITTEFDNLRDQTPPRIISFE